LGITSMLPWEEHGYTICGCVKDGNEALEKIPVLQPDIILTDVMMQPMDGLTLLQRCAHEYPHIRFIMLSNYTDFQNVKRAMQLGASDYIFKLEISETELLHSLDNLAVHHDASSSQSNYADLQADSFFLKHNLLEKLMLQDLASPHTQSLLCQLSVMPSFANYRLVALQAKVYTAEGNDSFSFKRAVQNLIESILPSEESLCFWYKDNTFLIYLPLQANDRADFDGRFEQIYNYAKRYLGASVIGATSAAMQGISQFASAASSTFSMLQMHFYAPDQKFFQENALCAMPLSHQTLQIFLQKTLPAFLHQPQEECAAVMADIFNALAQYHMLPALFKKALTSLFE
ncbi:MAG: response regulator, partial [Ruthenibacterium sp.]